MADLRALLDAATPGPWTVEFSTGVAEDEDGNEIESAWMSGPRMLDMGDYQTLREDDAALIVALVNAAPALLDVVEAARLHADVTHADGFTEVIETLIDLREALARLEETR